MQDPLKAHFDMFARYNAWANARVYDAARALSDADYRADRGAFFKSVHGTLNHLLVTDRVWMHRFTGEGAAPERWMRFSSIPSRRSKRRAAKKTRASSNT
ncbi:MULTISPECIES: DinB family protein [unclassified Caballeronia]|jgi:uncharacterized damage-inducible protein DinB|uniref:DinB family protein n=1 Tax=unclassified Caballeronia TaxID=2646786 RepID=UPI0020278FB3|nr:MULTISPECIES: DinB family protein [unclassified Caballeronia]